MDARSTELSIPENIELIVKRFFENGWNKKDFLTEDDLRCHLFNALEDGLKNFTNVSVHAEIRWYGNRDDQATSKLRYRSDIVIINPHDLQIDESIFKLPSKGYGFDKYHAIIEIKLRRPNNKDSDAKYEQRIKKDINKLKEIRNKTTNNFINKRFYLVVFDKKRNKKAFKNFVNGNDSLDWQNWN